MEKAAIVKAESRLRIATTHAGALAHCKSHDEFCDTWYQFLVAHKNVYTALEKGARPNAKSRQWFGAQKAKDRDDPMLQYLFQARDADEHGIEPVAELVRGSIALGVRKPGFSEHIRISNLKFENGVVSMDSLESVDGKPVLIEQTNSHSRLSPVTARGPVVYPVPTMHKGKPLADAFPATLAGLAVAHLSGLIADARKLA